MSPRADQPPPAEGYDVEPAIDFKRIVDFVFFVLHAPKRRPRLSVTVFACVAAASVVALVLVPRVYHVEVKVLAQTAPVMSSLGNPQRSIPKEADDPTRSAKEWITRHDSLVALVKDTNLIDRWNGERPLVLKLKDAITTSMSGEPREEDKFNGLVGYVEKKLTVAVDGSVVSIGMDWPTGGMAYELVSRSLDNFLNERLAADVSVINETIAIIQGHADKERQTMDAALVEMQRSRAARTSAANDPAPGTASVTAPRPGGAAAPRASAGSQDVAAALTETRRAIRAIEEVRKRDMDELRRRRTELRATYTEFHPSVKEVEQKIQASTKEPEELVALRAEERSLASKGADQPAAGGGARNANAAQPATAAVAAAPVSMVNDEAFTNASVGFEAAKAKYEELMGRIDAARIELDTSNAAFKYRFTTIIPPEVPKSPIKPKPAMIVGGGLFLAILLGIFSAAAADFASGRLIESWQVKRRLKLDILGDVECP